MPEQFYFECKILQEGLIRLEIDGKKYLKSSTNILYDAATQDMVGMWNEATKSIDFTEESEDSEEEDE